MCRLLMPYEEYLFILFTLNKEIAFKPINNDLLKARYDKAYEASF